MSDSYLHNPETELRGEVVDRTVAAAAAAGMDWSGVGEFGREGAAVAYRVEEVSGPESVRGTNGATTLGGFLQMLTLSRGYQKDSRRRSVGLAAPAQKLDQTNSQYHHGLLAAGPHFAPAVFGMVAVGPMDCRMDQYSIGIAAVVGMVASRARTNLPQIAGVAAPPAQTSRSLAEGGRRVVRVPTTC